MVQEQDSTRAGKLKNRKPVIQGSPICDEILYLSHRLRQVLVNRSQINKLVTNRDFTSGFWPACKKTFVDVVGAIPSFTILTCGEYFSRVLSIPDSLSRCLFQFPRWFVSLPAPVFPFDIYSSSYAEI